MSARKLFIIGESERQIRQRIKSSPPIIAKRLHALLIFKRHEHAGISKRDVAEQTGADANSVQRWRSAYIEGGIERLCSHRQGGLKPSVFTPTQQQALAERLHDPHNGTVGFIELLDWFNRTHGTGVNYKTFHGFVVRRFGAKIKTARKTHVKKDEAAVAAFKKTSRKTAKPSSREPAKALRR